MKTKTIYTILDFETTGLDHNVEQITEVGIIKTDFKDIYEELNFYVQLENGRTLSDFIKKLTGITEEKLKTGKTLSDAKELIKDFIKDTTLVAQFASFDLGFIKEIEVPEFYCTRTISTLFHPNVSHSLVPMCKMLGIQLQEEHRALNDCKMTMDLFKLYLDKYSLLQQGLLNTMNQTTERPLRYIPQNARVISLD